MICLLVGFIVGFLGGFVAAYVAFNGVTKRMAQAVYEGTEPCHR